MIKKTLIISIKALFYLSYTVVIAQNVGNNSIIGTILDSASEQPLVGATISVKDSGAGTFSNSDGSFTIDNLPDGKYILIISFLGYAEQKIEDISLSGDTIRNLGTIFQEEGAFSLNQITVTPGSFSIMGQSKLSRQTLTSKDIQNMSWAEDITRAVARLPGMSSSDYSSKFTVRGGEADEVLISLDGMELYESCHQRDYSEGLFSIVDIETIDNIELMTGGFAADHGNRLSGVFNMKTKHIADNSSHTSLGLSVMNARLYTDGKFANNRGSYIFSARRGMLDLVFKALGTTENLPSFYDGMFKIEYALNAKHYLSFHALRAGDRAKIRDISETGDYDIYDTKYGNTYAWVTLKSFYKQNLFSQTLLSAGNINHDRSGGFEKYDNSDKGKFTLSDQRDYSVFGLKQDWNWQPSNNLLLRTGFEVKQLTANYQYRNSINEIRVNTDEVLYNFDQTIDISSAPKGQQIGFHFTAKYKILNRLLAETGLRYDYVSYTKDKPISPRLSFAYALGENTFLRAAWGHYYQSQFINNLDVNNDNINFNKAELAKHYVLGFEHLLNKGISLRIEAYYKDLSNISPLWQNMRDHLEVYPEARNDNARIVFNGSEAKGIEFFLKYDQGHKLSWWFSYALAKATDNISDIEFDGLLTKRTGKVPKLNDQRHTVYTDINYRPSGRWYLNLSWHYYRGWPRTDYTYRAQVLPSDELHFYQVHKLFNATIYPAYHRMDIRANRKIDLKTGEMTVFVHLVNLYNRNNLKKFDLDTTNEQGEISLDGQGNYIASRDDKYWLGFTPVMGVRWDL
ncbi:MAG: TonB-dependent receptor [Saprospiraceae bacterium]|nr:TonB-dependent receptor [Saprospiraceae bacterium]